MNDKYNIKELEENLKDLNINIIEDINHDVDEISDIKIDRRKSCN